MLILDKSFIVIANKSFHSLRKGTVKHDRRSFFVFFLQLQVFGVRLSDTLSIFSLHFDLNDGGMCTWESGTNPNREAGPGILE